MALSKSPGLARFLSDFTLGFSDGLTVPFALTAGLSSLGKTETVIYAGLADLCAGSISMGIGGYLAALDELPRPSTDGGRGGEKEYDDDVELLRDIRHSSSSSGNSDDDEDSIRKGSREAAQERLVARHLEPLGLPCAFATQIVAKLRNQPGSLDRAVRGIEAAAAAAAATYNEDDAVAGRGMNTTLPIRPITSGLSISLGYAVGGAIPLLPYFFAGTVGLGLRWSIGLCLFALMAFGSGKRWLLGGDEATKRQCLWSGLQMLALGSIAAAAAVLCVSLVGSLAEK